jgi:hypothetical protein
MEEEHEERNKHFLDETPVNDHLQFLHHQKQSLPNEKFLMFQHGRVEQLDVAGLHRLCQVRELNEVVTLEEIFGR